MLLGIRFLDDVGDVNTYRLDPFEQWHEGDPHTIYLMIVDEDAGTSFGSSGRRYMPAAGATLQVVLDNVDDARKITKVASQPFPLDASIWKVDVLAADSVRGTVTLRVALTEGADVRRAVIQGKVRIRPNGVV